MCDCCASQLCKLEGLHRLWTAPKVGTTALFELQSLPYQHQCRCCPYFRFSVIRIPFSFRFLVSPPFPHPLQLQRESGASRILFTACSYSGKVVVRTAGVLVSKSTNICFSWDIISAKMVGNISDVLTEYEERVRRLQKVPRFSYGRRMVRSDGAPNRAFFYSLFNDHAMAIEFLQDIGLIWRTMQCNSCGRDMMWFRLHAYFYCHVPLIIRSPMIIFRLQF